MQKPDIPSIAGFPRKLYYDEDDGNRILTQHREIADEYGVDKPYFDYVETTQDILLEEFTSELERVRVGKIGAFPGWQVAVWLHEQVNSYVVVSKTMGEKYPSCDEATNQKLVAAMIGDYNLDRIIVSFEQKSREGNWMPYAGVQAYMGVGKQTIKQAIEGEHTDSLSTLSALTIDWSGDDSLAYLTFLREYGTVKEEEIIEMSRLWRRDNEALRWMGIENNELGWEVMAFLAVGIERAVLDNQVIKPRFLLYDTNKKIQAKLSDLFEMKQIVHEAFLRPTKAILESILAYHYGGSDMGGYAGQLIMGMATLGDYALNAKLYLAKRRGESNTEDNGGGV